MLYIKELELLSFEESPEYDPIISNLEPKYGGAIISSPEICYSKNDQRKSEKVINVDDIINITDKMSVDGRILWSPPSGDWTIYRFGYVTTG